MKTSLALGLALTTLLAVPAWAEPRTLSITGHGEVKAVPDMATIHAGVIANGPTAATALAANNGSMSAVMAALKRLGIPDRAIQTSHFSVMPQYTNGDRNNPRRLTGYQVSNEVAVRLDDLSRAGSILDALVAAGANQMNGINFDIAKPEPLLDQARTQAVADARHRAELYARAAGVSLGPLLSIAEGGITLPPRPMYRMAAAMDQAAVSPGEDSVSAAVSMVWEIH